MFEEHTLGIKTIYIVNKKLKFYDENIFNLVY